MTEVIDKPAPPIEAPLYKLIQPFYVDDNLIPSEEMGSRGLEATVIEFWGEPNEAMEPMNASARANMGKFLLKLMTGNKAAGRAPNPSTPPLAEIVGEAMANRPKEAPTRIDGIPPMANTAYENNNASRFHQVPERPPAAKVVAQETPIALRPRKVMGTIVKEESILS